jgi:membrane protease YdiL (CAAX protease family)
MVAVGAGALLARPLLFRTVADPTVVLGALFVALGLVGTCWPLAPRSPTGSGRPGPPSDEAPAPGAAPGAALVLGVGAFAVGRLLGAGTTVRLAPPVAPLLLSGLAAVAEEAFFRRLVYGLLAPRGPAVAVAGAALCFAAVHATVWGVAVLPLDLAAGLLLGWQRAATGRWSVSAVTHVAANVLAAL